MENNKIKTIISVIVSTVAVIALVVVIAVSSVIIGASKNLVEEEHSKAVTSAGEYAQSLCTYALLNDADKGLYVQLLTALQDFNSFSCSADKATVEKILNNYVLADFPEIFWSDGTVEVSSGTVTVGVTMTAAEAGQYHREIEKTLKEIVENSTFDEAEDDYDYAVKCFEWVCANLTQAGASGSEDDGKSYGGIWSAVLQKKADSEGYAKLLQLLLAKRNIPCHTVIGTLKDNRDKHWFNVLTVNGETFYTDAFLADNSEGVMYEYFGQNADMVKITRAFNGLVTGLPEGQAESNYLVKNGYLASAPTREEIERVFKLCAQNRVKPMQVMFSSAAETEQAKQLLSENNTLSDIFIALSNEGFTFHAFNIYILNTPEGATVLYVTY